LRNREISKSVDLALLIYSTHNKKHWREKFRYLLKEKFSKIGVVNAVTIPSPSGIDRYEKYEFTPTGVAYSCCEAEILYFAPTVEPFEKDIKHKRFQRENVITFEEILSYLDRGADTDEDSKEFSKFLKELMSSKKA
jgi:hypothetical protein